MNLIDQFLRLAEEYAASQGISENTLSYRMFRDNKIIRRLRTGSDIGVRRLTGALIYLSERWPDGLDWPTGTPRPAPAGERA